MNDGRFYRKDWRDGVLIMAVAICIMCVFAVAFAAGRNTTMNCFQLSAINHWYDLDGVCYDASGRHEGKPLKPSPKAKKPS